MDLLNFLIYELKLLKYKSPRWLGFTRVKTILDRDTYINKEILQESLIKEESNLHCSSTISGRITAEVNLV